MIREFTQPLETEINLDQNIIRVLEERVHRKPEDSLIEYQDTTGVWSSFSAVEFLQKVRNIAKGLINQGVKKGDSVSIISHTSWKWTALDIAVMSIGAITVPVYETNSPSQMRMIFNDSNVTLVFVENLEIGDKVHEVEKDCKTLRDCYVIENDALEIMEEYGRSVDDTVLDQRIAEVHGDDLATIVYTSGSTGTPKGIELSPKNFVFITYAGVHSMGEIAFGENRRLLLFLPLAHVFARYMQFFCFAGDVTLGLSSNLKTILADFSAFKPSFLLAVPRIFEKIFNAASQKAGSGLKGKIFARSVSVAIAYSKAQQSGEPIPNTLAMQHFLYKKLVYKNILSVFGGNAKYAISGGAPLNAKIAHFFNGIGLPLLEGYGMTETCAPATVNPTTGYKVGTIGIPMQGVSIGVDEEGELCIKAPSVCVGYHNHPEITEQQIVDGWLHTGDLGSIDEDGFVRITGRKKDLIITAGGKNVSPSELETTIMTSPVVAQCVLVGDRKPFISAIISLDLQDTNEWLKSKGAQTVNSLEEARSNPIVQDEVSRIVAQANEQVSRAESVRKYEIVADEFTEENGLLTASLKTRRKAVTDYYRDLINNVIYVPRKK